MYVENQKFKKSSKSNKLRLEEREKLNEVDGSLFNVLVKCKWRKNRVSTIVEHGNVESFAKKLRDTAIISYFRKGEPVEKTKKSLAVKIKSKTQKRKEKRLKKESNKL